MHLSCLASPRIGRRFYPIACIVAALAMLAGCSGHDSANEITQAVARVDKDEITEQQVNQILERQRGLKPEQLEAASRRAVGALVDQEILLQKAKELKLDRDPKVVSGLEAARRDLVSRAYLERVAEGAAPPTAEDVRNYYESKPALFSDRRVYSLQELAVEATPEQRAEIEAKLQTLGSPTELEAFLKSRQLRVRGERSTVPAENLPLALLDRLASVKPGRGIVVPADDGLRIILVVLAEPAPVTLEQTRPSIEAFLLNERKRVVVEREMKALREATKVEYLGKYKGMAASGTPATAAAPAPPAAASASGAPRPPITASGPMDEATTSKGLAGLK